MELLYNEPSEKTRSTICILHVNSECGKAAPRVN